MKRPTLHKLIFSILLFLFSQINYGQGINDKVIQGKITVDSFSVYGINVLNLRSEKRVVTNSDGVFFILAKANEALGFLRVNLKNHKEVVCDVPIGLRCIN